jgi:channel protein (hemolysin III family)
MGSTLIVTSGAVIFATLLFISLFRYLEPAKVASDYKPCSGSWHEAELEGCSQGLLKIPQQPVNTYTNLAYLAAGLWMQLSLGTGPAFVFALTMMYLCLGSTLYHATSTGWAGMLDVTGIYTVFSSTLIYALAALIGQGGDPLVPAAMFVAAGGTAFFLSKRRHSMQWVIALLLGSTYLLLILRMAITHSWSPLIHVGVSVGLFAVGFTSWVLDQRRRFPLPRWGHGVWHLFTAAASAVAFHAIDLTVRTS